MDNKHTLELVEEWVDDVSEDESEQDKCSSVDKVQCVMHINVQPVESVPLPPPPSTSTLKNQLATMTAQYNEEKERQELEKKIATVKKQLDELESNKKRVDEAKKKAEQILESKYHIATVKFLLDAVACIKGKDNKKMIVSYMYNYLIDNRGLVDTHPSFREAVRNKLIEFIANDQLREGVDYYTKLFGKDDFLRLAVEKMKESITLKVQ